MSPFLGPSVCNSVRCSGFERAVDAPSMLFVTRARSVLCCVVLSLGSDYCAISSHLELVSVFALSCGAYIDVKGGKRVDRVKE